MPRSGSFVRLVTEEMGMPRAAGHGYGMMRERRNGHPGARTEWAADKSTIWS